MTQQCVNCPGAEDHSTAQCPLVSVQKNELRQIITDALVSMVSGVTGLVPPAGPGAIPDFIQAPIDRAVERISASLSVGVPDREWILHMLTDKWPDDGEMVEVEFFRNWLDEVIDTPAAPTVKAEQPDCVYCQGHGDVTRISGQTAESYAEHNEECPECKGTGLAPSLPAAGSAVEEVEVVAYLGDGGTLYPNKKSVDKYLPIGRTAEPLMTVAQHKRIVSALSAQQSAPDRVSVPVELVRKLVRTYENAVIDAAHWTDMDGEVTKLSALLASHGRGEA